MRRIYGGRIAVFAAVIISGLIGIQTFGGQSQSSSAGLPSETPAKLEPATSSFDYVRRGGVIPMRDGVKLHTVILGAKGGEGGPSCLARTPSDGGGLTNQ